MTDDGPCDDPNHVRTEGVCGPPPTASADLLGGRRRRGRKSRKSRKGKKPRKGKKSRKNKRRTKRR